MCFTPISFSNTLPGWLLLAKITIPIDFPCQFCMEFIFYTPSWAFWIRSYNSQFPQYCAKWDRWPSKIGHSILLEKKAMWLTWHFRKPKDNIRWSKNIFDCRARSCPQPWKSLENGHFLHHFWVILTIPIDPHFNFVWNSWITHFSWLLLDQKLYDFLHITQNEPDGYLGLLVGTRNHVLNMKLCDPSTWKRCKGGGTM